MIALDFSGTLSLAASRYGREEHLQRKLKETGLWALGVDSTRRFWTEIVNPTWEEGSTTPKGYQWLLYEQLRRLAAAQGVRPEEARLRACAAAFVTDYFNHSVLAPEWKPLLQQVAARPDVIAVIATDHYAEATGHILSQVRALGIEAVPALRARRPGQILVANSADLGHPKASRAFWEMLKQAQKIERLSIVSIVDDFGANEQAQDAYASPEQIARRQEQTASLLAEVFSAQVRVFPFILEGQAETAESDAELIERASRFVRQALSNG